MNSRAAPSTKGLSRRNILIGGVLVCASGVAFARRPTIAEPSVDAGLFDSWVPNSFGHWKGASQSGVVLPPPDALRDRLYDNLVTRVYTAPEMPPIMLLIAYNNAQDGVLQVHRPEVCYPVGGFELSETRPMDLATSAGPIPANFFTAVGPNRTEQVAYFTRLGGGFPRSWAEQRLTVVRSNLAGDIPDGIMMRVSLLGIHQTQAQTQLSEFSSEFISIVNPNLKRLLLGKS